MKRKILISAILIGCATAAFAYFASVDGKWSATLKAPDGNDFPLSFTFKTDGDKLSGQLESQMGVVKLTDGKIKGDSIWFMIDMGNMKILNSGKYYADGDTISLNVDHDGHQSHTTLKRADDSK